MTNKIGAKQWYLENFKIFESKLNGESESSFHKVRHGALRKLQELEFPTVKNEEWKYTNVKPVLNQNFTPAANLKFKTDNSILKQEYLFEGFDHHLIVFVNGLFNPELSNIGRLPQGVIVDNLKSTIKNRPELVEKFLHRSKIITAFDALNALYAYDGLFIFIPEGKALVKPIHVMYINGDNETNVLSQPKNTIIAESNSQVSVITNYVGTGSKNYFSNIVTEVFTDANAVVDLYKIQNEKTDSFHIERTEIHQKKESVFSHFNISFGGALIRNDINSTLDDEFCECNFNGLYLANDKQHVDNHTFVDHATPNCLSNELYKGILDDESHGVFNGKILVRKDAQKTNAYQSNKTVLMSKKATIDTKPQLEIYADDVKCSHGATVGHLDDTAFFYIRSRGVPSSIAKSMLIRAFVSDVIEKVKIESLKEKLNHMIFEHLNREEI